MASRYNAIHRVAGYGREVEAFTAFLQRIAQHLPADYAQHDGPEWLTDIQTNVTRRAEDLTFLRYVLCVLSVNDAEKRQLAPDLWARFTWDVYHGGSVGVVLTSSSPEPSANAPQGTSSPSAATAGLVIASIFVAPSAARSPARRTPFGTRRQLVRPRQAHLAAVRSVGPPRLRSGGQPGVGSLTQPRKNRVAALGVVLAEPDVADVETPVMKRPRVPQIRRKLKRIRAILTRHFGCKWSMAKGGRGEGVSAGRQAVHIRLPRHRPQGASGSGGELPGKARDSAGDFIAACG